MRRSEIRGVDIDNPYMNVMTALTVPDIDDVTVVDYDALEERIYWADIKTQTIKRAFINGTQLETIISVGGCILDIHTKCKVKAACVKYFSVCVYQLVLISGCTQKLLLLQDLNAVIKINSFKLMTTQRVVVIV